MSAGRKRETMAKQTRERAVREKRALKQERKREAANLRLAGADEAGTPVDGAPDPGLHVVAEPGAAEAGDPQEDGGAGGSDA
jgi:hypothetical protein